MTKVLKDCLFHWLSYDTYLVTGTYRGWKFFSVKGIKILIFSGQKMRGLRKIRKINLLCYCKIFLIPNLAGRVILRVLHPRTKLPPTQRKIEMQFSISELPRNLTKIVSPGDSEWPLHPQTDFIVRKSYTQKH